MNDATLAALLLLGGGWLQSFSYLCSKLPAERLPPGYPRQALHRLFFNLAWLALFASGTLLAFGVSPWLGLVGAVSYFALLPFTFQLPMVRLFGFRNYRQFIAAVDGTGDTTRKSGEES